MTNYQWFFQVLLQIFPLSFEVDIPAKKKVVDQAILQNIKVAIHECVVLILVNIGPPLVLVALCHPQRPPQRVGLLLCSACPLPNLSGICQLLPTIHNNGYTFMTQS